MADEKCAPPHSTATLIAIVGDTMIGIVAGDLNMAMMETAYGCAGP